MRGASIVMIMFSVSIVFMGAAELTHDFLHYLNELHLSTLHAHEHDHHHSFHDHEHPHHHDHSKAYAEHDSDEHHHEAVTLPLSFFLYHENQIEVLFSNSFVYLGPIGATPFNPTKGLLPPTLHRRLRPVDPILLNHTELAFHLWRDGQESILTI